MLGRLDKKATQSSCFGFGTYVAKESANKRIANFSVFEGSCCVTLLGDTIVIHTSYMVILSYFDWSIGQE